MNFHWKTQRKASSLGPDVLPECLCSAMWFLLRASRESCLLQLKRFLIHMMGLKLDDRWRFSTSSTMSRCSATWSQMKWCNALPKPGRVGWPSGNSLWACGSFILWSWTSASTSLGLSLPIYKTARRGLIRLALSKFYFGWKLLYFISFHLLNCF